MSLWSAARHVEIFPLPVRGRLAWLHQVAARHDGGMTSLPSSRILDPLDAPAIRWGVLAPGGIARDWTAALHATTASRVVAAGSRSLERAQAFAAEFGVERSHGSYEALVADGGVDAVYVASPHSQHHEHALLALGAGKPVLVEKAFTRNGVEATAVVEAARAAGLLAVEAMWTRFLPHIDVVRRCLEDGVLGEVKAVEADHGQLLYPDGPRRLADPALAGGALLDLAIYPISFAHLALGGFTAVRATGTLAETGVDASETVAVTGAQGAIGTLASTMLAKTPCSASISGAAARLEIDGWFYRPNTVRLVGLDDREIDRYEPPSREHGLAYEAAEFARLLAAGKTESDLLPLDETLRIMHVLDDVRAQLGVRFPGER
ncbi:Gfo/Idh/MocA family protein [uncultured Jatrophihabitans sp.]|uniref:Gfo/Idh/MocA family protein n=1 Tax=uncultured Jatrophihabitans sp. TaxID=1610747 RepID=UPI0035CC4009